MIDLSQNNISHREALRRLSFPTGQRSVRYQLHVCKNGVRKGQLTLLSHKFSFSYESPVKFFGTFTIEPSGLFDPGTDLLEFSMVLLWGKEELRYPFTRLKPILVSEGEVLTIEAKDETEILRRASLGSRRLFPAGTLYTAAVEALLAESGFYNIAITPSLRALASDREDWAPECCRLTVINDLLSEIGYRSLECLPGGLTASGPYQSPDSVPAQISYQANQQSVILSGSTRSAAYLAPNHFVGYVSDPKSPPMRSEYKIEEPQSPLSPSMNGGYWISTVKEFRAACDQESLDLNLRRWANEQAVCHESITLRTAVMPHHGVREIVYLDCGALSGTFVETDFTITDTMSHTLRRVRYN